MPYPHVIQFETLGRRAREAVVAAELERRAVRPPAPVALRLRACAARARRRRVCGPDPL